MFVKMVNMEKEIVYIDKVKKELYTRGESENRFTQREVYYD